MWVYWWHNFPSKFVGILQTLPNIHLNENENGKQKMSFCLYNKKNIIQRLDDVNSVFSCEINILLTHIVLPLENKIHIFAPPCNILYIPTAKSIFCNFITRLDIMCTWTRFAVSRQPSGQRTTTWYWRKIEKPADNCNSVRVQRFTKNKFG